MTDDNVIIFEKLKLKKNRKTNKCKNNFDDPLFEHTVYFQPKYRIFLALAVIVTGDPLG